jgi:hypothetical protein
MRRTDGSTGPSSHVLRLILAGPVAQLGARVNGIHEVRGSNPLWSTIFLRGACSARQKDAG